MELCLALLASGEASLGSGSAPCCRPLALYSGCTLTALSHTRKCSAAPVPHWMQGTLRMPQAHGPRHPLGSSLLHCLFSSEEAHLRVVLHHLPGVIISELGVWNYKWLPLHKGTHAFSLSTFPIVPWSRMGCKLSPFGSTT